MALSEENQKHYHNNVKAMLDLLTDSDRNSVGVFLVTLMLTTSVIIMANFGVYFFLWMFVVMNMISIYGTRTELKHICNPYTVTPYKNLMKMDDTRFKKSYAILKRTPFIKGVQWSAYAVEVYAIIIVADMLILGSICLMSYVLLENSIHNSNQNMKFLWNEQLEYEQST